MKRILKDIFIYIVLFTLALNGKILANSFTIYSDAEDGTIAGWSVEDDDPAGAYISNVYDSEKGSRVIALRGNGFENSYGLKRKDGNYWYNTDQFIFQWSMKTNSYVRVFVYVLTYEGYKYLYYDSTKIDTLQTTDYLHHQISENSYDGKWHTFTRNLRQDLRDYEPDNDILSVEWMVVRGDAYIDDVMLMSDEQYRVPRTPSSLNYSIVRGKLVKLHWKDSATQESYYLVYRDGKEIAKLPPNSTSYLDRDVDYDTEYLYEVYAVNDRGRSKGVFIKVRTPKDLIPKAPSDLQVSVNYRTAILRWKDNSDNETFFEIYRNGEYVADIPANSTEYRDEWLDLEKTYKYEVYAVNNDGRSSAAVAVVKTGKEIYKPTGPSNLSAVVQGDSIKLTWKDNSNIETMYKIIRNGELLASLPANVTQFEDISIRPNTVYTYEVVASNSLGDSKAARVTIRSSYSGVREEQINENVYEDAEDGTTNKWIMYDTSGGGGVYNVYDFGRKNRVIKLEGEGYKSGFWLRKSNGSLWQDTQYHKISWKSKFDSTFIIYVYVKTTKGEVYLQYIPVDRDVVIGGKYNFALGSFAKDGRWHTFKRDIEEDLRKLPDFDGELISIEGFLVRGHGYIDDVKTFK